MRERGKRTPGRWAHACCFAGLRNSFSPFRGYDHLVQRNRALTTPTRTSQPNRWRRSSTKSSASNSKFAQRTVRQEPGQAGTPGVPLCHAPRRRGHGARTRAAFLEPRGRSPGRRLGIDATGFFLRSGRMPERFPNGTRPVRGMTSAIRTSGTGTKPAVDSRMQRRSAPVSESERVAATPRPSRSCAVSAHPEER
jgi:hypothetical protein